ncbi:protein-L-isoaspartate O-methyltransferase [Actinoplanes sp. NPDC051859]|uniref:protein-L-isoaspartate O-methyltransferase n=1 Tax=Actinoplanes sp. NPDC051859 TaxID=3363909 RepID=UPI00378F97BF
MTDLRRRYVERIRRDGAPLSPQLSEAFASVPRELFVTEGFQRRDGTWARPGSAGFLERVYSNDVLVTKVDGGVPVSSSSQPSLMAIMLAALAVQPGDRVLEIGAGTGYNAALLTALGARVTTVDVQDDVVARARAALQRAGVEGVRVVAGDGYAGVPNEHFDRVIVTVGVAGLSPHWLAQAESPRPGPIVVPVEHAGTHPVLAVHCAASGSDVAGPGVVTGRVVCSSGFMTAAGPLTARHPGAHPHPVPATALTAFRPAAPSRWEHSLDSLAYRDLWYAAGVWSTRATHAAVPGRDGSTLILLDEEGTGGAAILPDGMVLAGGAQEREYAAAAAGIVDRWEAASRPPMQAWRITLARTGDSATPIWCPTAWDLVD